MQAADLISRIAVVIKQCNEDILMSHMGTVLFEYLGEEYPEVLGSIIGKIVCRTDLGTRCILYPGRCKGRKGLKNLCKMQATINVVSLSASLMFAVRVSQH